MREGRNRQDSAALGQPTGSVSRDRPNSISELLCRAKTPNKRKRPASFIPEKTL